MIQGIDIPDTIAHVVQHNGIAVQIEGKILFKYLVDFPVAVLKDNIRLLVDRLYITLIAVQILNAVAAVENDHF